MVQSAKKREDRRIKEQVRRDTKTRGRKVRVKATPKTSGPRDRNAYAASLLNPEGVKDAKVPDESTIPSITMQTCNKIPVTSTAATGVGYHYVCVKPSMMAGLYYPRIGPNGELSQQMANPVHDPAWEEGRIKSILNPAQIDTFMNVCAAIRPVSMSVRYIPTEAALTAQGLGGTGLYAGESLPAAWDSASSSVNGITDGTNVHLSNDLAPSNMDQALTAMKTEVNAMTEFVTYWGPEDEGDFEYRPLEATALTSGGSTQLVNQSNDATLGWRAMAWTEDDPAAPGNPTTYQYVTPWQYTTANKTPEIGPPNYVDPNTGYTCQLPIFTDQEMSLPWVAILFTGTQPGVTLGELVITINWEAIPNQSVMTVMPGTPSPSNPDEMAQATNLIRHLPETITSVVNDPNTKIRGAAMQSTTDLYDPGVSRKKAVEGTSFFDRVKKFAKNIDWSLVASAGKALLSFL